MDATVGPRPPEAAPSGVRALVRRFFRRPAVAVLLLAPFLGEVLSTSTPPLDLLVPWILVLQVALYGCGALLCRELARRSRLGLPGLLLLAAAYGVWEEAFITGFWFDAGYQDKVGIGAYGRVWHTNLLVATHLTAFHVAVGIGSSVLLVERMFPAHRDRPWAGPRGLASAAVALAVLVPFLYGTALRGPTGPLLAAGAVGLALVGAAYLMPRRAGRPRPARVRSRFAGTIAFVSTGTHFVLVYALPSTGVPWPAGIALTLAPLAVAAVLLRRRTATGDAYGPAGLRIVTGILSFFIVLAAVVGLGGRYDLTAGAVATALVLRRLARRSPPTGGTVAGSGPWRRPGRRCWSTWPRSTPTTGRGCSPGWPRTSSGRRAGTGSTGGRRWRTCSTTACRSWSRRSRSTACWSTATRRRPS